MHYSGTFDRDPRRYRRPLYNGHLLQPHANIYFSTSKIGVTSLQGKKIVGPIVSLVQRFHSTELYGNTLS